TNRPLTNQGKAKRPTPEQTTTTARKTKAAPPNKPGTAKQNQALNNPKPFPSIMSAILTRGAS
ncbi:hypothetical protein PQR68_35815, partial [Paraburkholderia agricolaris]|uniref:hypothetical protein n=1 Tax=Paraburkholderia agricolaris TaxID=2152888 RepID=UPI0038B726E1